VTDIIATHRTLSTNFTTLCHIKNLRLSGAHFKQTEFIIKQIL